MNNSRLIAINNQLQSYVNDGVILGGGISGKGGNRKYTYTAGHQDIARTKLFTRKTIIRMSSDTKLMGTVAFLKLIENGKITGQEFVSNWIPEFANTKVIDPYFPSSDVTLNNPLTATLGSNVLNVFQPEHGFTTGHVIGLENATAVQGINAFFINAVHVVTVVDSDNYTITVLVPASGTSLEGEGGLIKIVSLEAGVKQQFFSGIYYYYKEIPLVRPIRIWHILTNTLGYLYNQIALGAVFGYADGTNDPIKLYKTGIQAGILQQLLIPAGFPTNFLPLSFTDIKVWAATLATVPLLFQPGEDWCYGPALSILGALTEYIDGRDFETYFRQELTEPLCMKDTGFFIQNNDPRRVSKLARIQTLAVGVAPGFFIDFNTIIPGFADYFFAADQPKKLALIDGGGYSTLDDRDRFYQMLENKGSLLGNRYFISPALVSAISSNKINDLTTLQLFPPAKNYKWGLGTAVGAGSDEYFVLPAETNRNVFWAGAFGTVYNVDFGNDSYINFVTNVFPLGITTRDLQGKIFNVHMTGLLKINSINEEVSPNPPTTTKVF